MLFREHMETLCSDAGLLLPCSELGGPTPERFFGPYPEDKGVHYLPRMLQPLRENREVDPGGAPAAAWRPGDPGRGPRTAHHSPYGEVRHRKDGGTACPRAPGAEPVGPGTQLEGGER